ncbi:MAG: 4Fe-4S single cluster domain-containing protein [Armatimonadetes bacterium]|nr:4Fe-4S single cluster domain-containing protein [Armatimonadota bacterium]
MTGAMYLRIGHVASGITVLGPGSRTVVWVQGCPFTCSGCISPEMRDPSGGTEVAADDLVSLIAEEGSPDGVTFSGGEPMEQAGDLLDVIQKARAVRDIGVVCYTGYQLEYLQQHGNTHQKKLLAEIDLLIDGLYVVELHADLLWRGSSNQRLLALTDRYRSLIESLNSDTDRSAGLEFHVDGSGTPMFSGVPSKPGFRVGFENAMLERGIKLRRRNRP